MHFLQHVIYFLRIEQYLIFMINMSTKQLEKFPFLFKNVLVSNGFQRITSDMLPYKQSKLFDRFYETIFKALRDDLKPHSSFTIMSFNKFMHFYNISEEDDYDDNDIEMRSDTSNEEDRRVSDSDQSSDDSESRSGSWTVPHDDVKISSTYIAPPKAAISETLTVPKSIWTAPESDSNIRLLSWKPSSENWENHPSSKEGISFIPLEDRKPTSSDLSFSNSLDNKDLKQQSFVTKDETNLFKNLPFQEETDFAKEFPQYDSLMGRDKIRKIRRKWQRMEGENKRKQMGKYSTRKYKKLSGKYTKLKEVIPKVLGDVAMKTVESIIPKPVHEILTSVKEEILNNE